MEGLFPLLHVSLLVTSCLLIYEILLHVLLIEMNVVESDQSSFKRSLVAHKDTE